ncbi:transmembrane protein, putative (macronuclear) [Tetrahymena thermophila SB210]|uniref:Transmembrane protein, putative n=1 Tax=Tetrahymena thermophila (strain SB210) TaxID=312017 RepID=Q22W76_TETTS|nr:transmembrane protein, putative [Tetrahymena thermophila SB210]EAR89541.1 transmembrane protein, putative [Tetrahymena thermophila SB210]|eukprot:XP_001009786.1 transmembrane protein, putative [Tetrahymena thermophila SB210]
MSFIKKIISIFDFSDDFQNEYLLLDYKILGCSILSAGLPLLGRFYIEQSKKNYFGASSTLINDIISHVKESPLLYFDELKEKSYPIIRATIEDPQGELKQSWIQSYVANNPDQASKVLNKIFKAQNPLDSSKAVNIVFNDLNVFNREISGYQLLAQNQVNPFIDILSYLDIKNSFKGVTPSSKQFFDFSDVLIQGIKLKDKQNGEYLQVTHVFKDARLNFTDEEIKFLSKTQKIFLYVSAGLGIFALIMLIRILIKKYKLKKQKSY